MLLTKKKHGFRGEEVNIAILMMRFCGADTLRNELSTALRDGCDEVLAKQVATRCVPCDDDNQHSPRNQTHTEHYQLTTNTFILISILQHSEKPFVAEP